MAEGSKTIFLTGGTGLVGSHAAEEAIRRGHRVRALVRCSSDTRFLDRLGVEKVEGDLADEAALRRGVAGVDWVFNCAAKVGDWGELDDFRTLNVDALRLLLDAAVEAGVKRFVHVSSLGVYEGRDHVGTDETVLPAIDSLDAYTRSKTEAEVLALAYTAKGSPLLDRLPYARLVFDRSPLPAERRRLEVVILRPGFIYGERDRTVLPKLLGRLRSRVFAYFGSGEQVLNCIYVKNLVHAIFLAAEVEAAAGEVFNLTDGLRITKRHFVGTVAELAGLPQPRRKIPKWLAYQLARLLERRARRRGATEPPLINMARYKFLALNLDYSIDKARRILGYRPPYTTDEGLRASVADLLANEQSQPQQEAVGT
jgi:nucleoside-diphosphate-sugar epimerase